MTLSQILHPRVVQFLVSLPLGHTPAFLYIPRYRGEDSGDESIPHPKHIQQRRRIAIWALSCWLMNKPVRSWTRDELLANGHMEHSGLRNWQLLAGEAPARRVPDTATNHSLKDSL